MSVISITFHTIASENKKWADFLENELHELVKNLIDVEKYIISEVYSDMITEGTNTNLLLIFDNEKKREEFEAIELLNISDIIGKKFGEDVMIFITLLKPKIMKL
jgi:hypothetical protein